MVILQHALFWLPSHLLYVFFVLLGHHGEGLIPTVWSSQTLIDEVLPMSSEGARYGLDSPELGRVVSEVVNTEDVPPENILCVSWYARSDADLARTSRGVGAFVFLLFFSSSFSIFSSSLSFSSFFHFFFVFFSQQ